MPKSQAVNHLGMQLLGQDKPVEDHDYQEYRMKLENALTTAERREKLTGRVAGVSLVVAFILLFAGGTKFFGSFDPWDKDATILSVTLGAMYWITILTGSVGLASYYSRFRPKIKEIKDRIQDTRLLAIQCEISELRKQISEIRRADDSA